MVLLGGRNTMIKRKNRLLSIVLILSAFTLFFVLSCSVLSVIQTEHGMMDCTLTHALHEHSEVPFPLPNQPLSVLNILILAVVVFFGGLTKTLFPYLFTHWYIVFRDYRRRMSECVSCFFTLLFQQGVLHPKTF